MGSQYDTGASVASRGSGAMLELTHVQLEHFLTNTSQHLTNLTVQKYDIRN